MKFDAISTVSEILPFYGKLDEAFRLLKRVNRKTNEIWNSTHHEMSKRIKRKSIAIGIENKKQFVEYPLKNQMMLTLFSSSILEVKSEENYKWLVELLKGVDDPKMLRITFGLSLSQKRDTNMIYSNYYQYTSYIDLTYLEYYRKIIKIAVAKEIPLYNLNAFLFIDEVLNIKDIEYVKYIVVPCRSDRDSEEIIKVWNEFIENKPFKFDSIRLIWNDMKVEHFCDVFKIISNSKVSIEIISLKTNLQFIDFLQEISDKKCSLSSYKFSCEDEYILWNYERQVNELSLRTWYYFPHFESKYAFEILYGSLQYSRENKEVDINNANFEIKDVLQFRFSFKSFKVSKFKIRDRKDWIHFRENTIEFNNKLIKTGRFQKKGINGKIYSLRGELSVTSYCILNYTYWKSDSIAQLKITKSSLNQSDTLNLIRYIYKIGNLKSLTLSITDPSLLKMLLYLFYELPFLNSMIIHLSNPLNAIQYFDLKSAISHYRSLGKKILIRKSIQTSTLL